MQSWAGHGSLSQPSVGLVQRLKALKEPRPTPTAIPLFYRRRWRRRRRRGRVPRQGRRRGGRRRGRDPWRGQRRWGRRWGRRRRRRQQHVDANPAKCESSAAARQRDGQCITHSRCVASDELVLSRANLHIVGTSRRRYLDGEPIQTVRAAIAAIKHADSDHRVGGWERHAPPWVRLVICVSARSVGPAAAWVRRGNRSGSNTAIDGGTL